MIVYFSCLLTVFYYLGAMQVVISTLGRFLAFCLGTGPAESVNAAGGLFVRDFVMGNSGEFSHQIS